MANPTTYFGWVMPNSADLVTDLPADFNVFGQGVDTSMSQLLGGTTGQVLSKTSATNMAFTWINNDQGDITGVTAGTGITGGGTSGTVTVTNDMATTITAAGDIVVGTGSGTYDNLPIGTTNQVLTADTTVSPYKVKWATPSGGGKVLQVVYASTSTSVTNSTATYADTGLTATITPTLATSKVLVIVDHNGNDKSAGNVSNRIQMRLMRGASALIGVGDYFLYNGTAVEIIGETISFSYLDAPSTTSATTYKTQFLNPVGVANVIVQFNSSSTSTITLLEIGA